jgi:hypothetical protein
MIIWLASYPRSGNTLLRQIFKQVFEQDTYSDGNDRKDLGIHDVGAAIVGHRSYTVAWDEFYNANRNSDSSIFIKTHSAPRDSGKTIYIVRDGRAALVSYFHFLHDFRRNNDLTLREVIHGNTFWGSWTAHLDKWQPQERPATLLLRYEDLQNRPEQCISTVANFTGLEPRREWRSPLKELREAMPGFFRSGEDHLNIKEIQGADERKFWELHGAWMKKLGYA